MDIVIITEFCEDFSKTDNDRFFYLAKMLAEENDVEIITSSFRHTTKSQRYRPAEEWPFAITFIDEPGYPKNVCLKRFYSHFVWGINVYNYLRSRKKPDVVYCAVPSLTGPNLIAKYCEKENIRFIIDVQDLWPEAFQMVFNVPVLSNIIFAPFENLADGIYKRADAICAVSETYCQRALKKNIKCKEATAVYLGTNLNQFDDYSGHSIPFLKSENEFWLGYAGTLGTSYDLPLVFQAMRTINHPSLRFIVMGDGPLMDQFKENAEGLNVTFTGRLPYEQMCSILTKCDVVVNPIVGKSVATIINKHADYAASGKPVLNTQNSEEYQRLVEEYRMGFNCRNNDPEDLATKLKLLIENEQLRKTMGKNARRCAEERFDRKKTYTFLTEQILHW